MRIYQRAANKDGHSYVKYLGKPAELEQRETPLLDLSRPAVLFFPGIQTIDDGFAQSQHAKTSLALKSGVMEKLLGDPSMYGDKLGIQFVTMTYSPWRLFRENTDTSPQDDEKKQNRWGGLRHGTERFLALVAEQTRKLENYSGKYHNVLRYFAEPDSFFSSNKDMGIDGAKEFTDAVIIPALKDSDHWPDAQKLSGRLKHLTLTADSYGSIFAHEVGNYLGKVFTEAGFSKEETKKLLEDIVFIGASSLVESDKKVNPFTGIYLEADGDVMRKTASKLRGYVSMALHGGPDVLPVLMRSKTREFMLDNNGEPDLSSSRKFSPLEQQDIQEALQALKQEYSPPPEGHADASEVWLDKVDKGAVIHFRPKQNYSIVMNYYDENGTKHTEARHYNNNEKHQSYCYTYPFPGHRDHADLLARALRNAVSRVNDPVMRPFELLTRPTTPLSQGFAPRFAPEAKAVNKHLNELLERKLIPDLRNRHGREYPIEPFVDGNTYQLSV
jgi:hypothetical protein